MSLLHEFLKQSDEGYIVVDSNKKVSYANRFILSLDVLRDNWQDKPYYEVVKNLGIISIISATFGDRISHNEEISIGDKEFSVRTFYTDEGIILRLSDVTVIKNYEKSKKEFVANVSHELKTPIAALKIILETVYEEDLPRHIKNMLKRALERVEEMNQLVSDLLIITKLESGEEVLNIQKINLKWLVDSIYEKFKDSAEREKINLINEVEEETYLYSDPEKISILLKNLVDNAIKYNRKGGKVGVRFHENNKWNIIEVWDTGIGIPKQDIPFVFDRFYRVDKSRSKDIPGTGLGLSIVKHIALSHGGRVEVESHEGKGSVFRVLLPKHGD